MHRTKRAAVVLAVLAALLPAVLFSQGHVTLESLAAALARVTQRQDSFDNRLVRIERELGIATATVAATSTPTATNTPAVTPTQTPAVSVLRVSDQKILDDYKDDKRAAIARYEGQIIQVAGEVLAFNSKRNYVQFDVGGIFSGVLCQLDAGQERVAAQLQKGQSIVVEGVGGGKFMGLFDIDNCTIISPTPQELPTATPQPTRTFTPVSLPTNTPTPTRTPRPKPTSTPTPRCNVEDVPEPPRPDMDCEIWAVSYQLITLELERHPAGERLDFTAETVYPTIAAGAQACEVSPTQLGDYIYRGAQLLEEAGKPSSSPDVPIVYLIGAIGASGGEPFAEIVEFAGGCVEAIALVVEAAE